MLSISGRSRGRSPAGHQPLGESVSWDLLRGHPRPIFQVCHLKQTQCMYQNKVNQITSSCEWILGFSEGTIYQRNHIRIPLNKSNKPEQPTPLPSLLGRELKSLQNAFPHTRPLYPHEHPMKHPLIPPIYRRGSWSAAGLSGLPQITAFVNGRAELDLRALNSEFQIIPLCASEPIPSTKPGPCRHHHPLYVHTAFQTSSAIRS